MSIQVIQNENVEAFLNVNEDLLLKDESMNNLILGISDLLKKGLRKFENPLFFTVVEGNRVLGQAIRSEVGRPFVLARVEAKALKPLAEAVFKKGIPLGGVVGPKESSTMFSDIWVELTGGSSQIAMHQGVYELTKVLEPKFIEGEMIVATTDNKKIVRDFTLGFIKECFPNDSSPEDRAKEVADRHIENGTLFLWKTSEGEIVSMASKNRESKNAATISLVYTPRNLRGKGFASCIVAKLSEKLLLDGKKKCNLFTDLTNPTSNSIYQKIGYKFLGESMHHKFTVEPLGENIG